MSKFQCPCGWSISDTMFPCPEESHVVSDDDLDMIINVDYVTYGPDYIKPDDFYDVQRNMLICSRCGRIHLQKAPRVNDYITYAKEVDATAHVVKLEAVLYQLVSSNQDDPWYEEVRKTAEKLLKRETDENVK